MSGFWLARGKTKSSFFDANVSAEHKDKRNPHFLDVRLRADTTGSISTDDHSAVQDAPLRLVAKREDMVWKLPGTSELTSAITKDESELPSVALMSLILRRFSSSSSKHSPSHHRPAAASVIYAVIPRGRQQHIIHEWPVDELDRLLCASQSTLLDVMCSAIGTALILYASQSALLMMIDASQSALLLMICVGRIANFLY